MKKKRKTKQQKVIDKTFEHVNGLLSTAQKAINEPIEDRYFIHHKLLELIYKDNVLEKKETMPVIWNWEVGIRAVLISIICSIELHTSLCMSKMEQTLTYLECIVLRKHE